MTPDERDRLATLEANYKSLNVTVSSIDDKLTKLIKAANMGEGAFWMFMKMGGLLVVVASAGAWLWEFVFHKAAQ